eukprot:TRINITY_DN5450_c0_g2_i1.p1 TRINITY_DN5450_c0_g2~~TRINITY_DN5450_c0_g2_i1.p1  ORF type:complete len:222 (+),score=64.50 TRINITY_DN5450_c0_g2_i1:100-666(+)
MGMPGAKSPVGAAPDPMALLRLAEMRLAVQEQEQLVARMRERRRQDSDAAEAILAQIRAIRSEGEQIFGAARCTAGGAASEADSYSDDFGAYSEAAEAAVPAPEGVVLEAVAAGGGAAQVLRQARALLRAPQRGVPPAAVRLTASGAAEIAALCSAATGPATTGVRPTGYASGLLRGQPSLSVCFRLA